MIQEKQELRTKIILKMRVMVFQPLVRISKFRIDGLLVDGRRNWNVGVAWTAVGLLLVEHRNDGTVFLGGPFSVTLAAGDHCWKQHEPNGSVREPNAIYGVQIQPIRDELFASARSDRHQALLLTVVDGPRN